MSYNPNVSYCSLLIQPWTQAFVRLVASVLTVIACICPAVAQVPDLTAGGVPTINNTINLGPTGLEGWMYHEQDPAMLVGGSLLIADPYYTGQSRQILVTAVDVGAPGDTAGLQVNDVILGASGDGSTPVDFIADARKSLALAIAAAEARVTPELKLKVWRDGSPATTSTYTLTLQNLGAYGPNAPVSDGKCDLIVENCRQAMLASSNAGSYGLGTLALMALDDPTHPDHAVMKAQIDAEIAALLPDAANLALMNSGVPETGSKIGWQRGHTLITLAEYYLNYGEHPSGGVLNAIQAHVNSITTGQSIFGTFGHIYAQFRWPDGDTTPMMGGYGAINSSAIPGLYGLLLAKQCGVTGAALDESIERGLTFYGSYANRGAIPYGEHTPATSEFSTNGKSGVAALVFDLATGKEEESKYFAKMSAASFNEYETGHTGYYFQNLWSPLGAAQGGDDAIKSYFAETSWLYDLARKWDGTFHFNILARSDVYSGFSTAAPYIMPYALPLKRLHMTGRGRSAAGVLNASERAAAYASGLYDEETRTKSELIADLGDWSAVVQRRAATALGGMILDSADMATLHALATDPVGTSREGALMALEKVADATSAPVLSGILSDPNPRIRRLAAKALLTNPAKNAELNTVLTAAAAAQRATFPMDPLDPLHQDLESMAQLLFSSTGILYNSAQVAVDLTGVDRELFYPALRALLSCPVGAGRSASQNAIDALTEADVQALGDVIVDTLYYRTPADPMFADHTIRSAMDILVKYDYAEGIPVAERVIRAGFNYNANRAVYGDLFIDLRDFGATSSLVTPDPEILKLCEDYIADLGGDSLNSAIADEARLTWDAIVADIAPTAPKYLKSFDRVVSDAAALTLPANQTQLHASVTDHAKGDLTYTWRQVYGPGNVTFGDASNKDTTITFDNTPGHYLFEVSVIDARGLSEIKETVAMTLYDVGGTLPSNLPPTANAQAISVEPGTPSPITLTGTDPESVPLVFTVTSQPAHGTLSGTAPNLTYLSDLSYHTGSDSFTFEVTDDFGQTSSATVSITVDPSLLAIHVHEPFDYTVGALLAGNSGGTGMTGAWLDGPVNGQAWIYDATTVATPVNTGAGTYSWDGVVDNLPTHAESGVKMVGLAALGGDNYEIHRSLAQDAGTMAGADNVLWASIAYHREAASFAQHLGFALTTDCFTNSGRQLDTSGSHGAGLGDGIGVARPLDVGSSYCAVVFDGGVAAATTTAPSFGSGDFVMVLKFEFGATDTVTAYAFREDEIISEASFNTRAVSATAAIDESTLNRITVASGRGDPSYDEIRVGDNFAAVIGLTESTEDVSPPLPDPMTFAVAPTANGSEIAMTATTATDPNGVEYYFTCTSGNGNDSGWQDSPSYTDVVGAGSYTYTVTARDKSVNRNITAPSAGGSATIGSLTPGLIAWEVFDVSGNISDVSTTGTLVEAHSGADLGTGNVVDGTTFTINGVTFDDGFVFDSPSHFDTIGTRGGSYPSPNADYSTLMKFADRQGSGTATFTFNNLTIGSTYQIQVWHADNVSTAMENGMVLNDGGVADTPVPGTAGHVTVVREISEGGYGQYAIGTFVADATTQQFLARGYGNLTTTPAAQSNLAINGCQIRLMASAADSTPPTLASSDIVDDQGGAPVLAGSVVVYDVTFSEAMDGSTVDPTDFSNAGSASGTMGTIVQVSPAVYQVRFNALTTGTLQLQVDAGAVLTDAAGNPLDTTAAILDDTVITVGAPSGNNPPVANNDAVNTNEDTAVAITLVATDADLDTLTYAVVTGPSNGSLSGTAPNLTYTPNGDHNGSDSFTFKANDGTVDSNIATVSITVNPANDAPVAANGSASTAEDTPVAVTLSATDIDSAIAGYTVVTGPANGSLSGVAPNLTYTPNGDFNGSDSFTFTASDGTLSSNVATISLTVTAVNDAPTFTSDPIVGSAATEGVIYASTIAGSATDADSGATLSYAKVSGPAWLTVAVDGTLSGTPASADVGANVFTVSVTDGIIVTPVEATLNITVNAAGGATMLLAGWDGTNAGAAGKTGTSITSSYVASGLGSPGWAVTDNNTNGLWGLQTFTPAADSTKHVGLVDGATATFTMTLINSGTSDISLDSVHAWVKRDVAASPTGAAISFVSSTDTDLTAGAGATLAFGGAGGYAGYDQSIAGVFAGTNVLSAGETVVIAWDFAGSGTENSRLRVGNVAISGSIAGAPSNTAPVASNGTSTTGEDTAVAIALSATDADLDPLTYAVVTGPANGVLSGIAPNLTYTPNGDYSGADSFTFKANDSLLDSNVATVSITVNAVNDAPVASNGSASTAEDTPVAVTLSATDIDSAIAGYTVVTGPANGSLSGVAPNLTYTPNGDFNGSDSLTFTASDGTLSSNVATISLTVTAVNDAPVASNGSASTAEDTAAAVTLSATDIDSAIASYTVVTGPANGSLSGTAPNLTYTPNGDFNGSDSFTFTASDGTLSSNVATISLTVTAVNDAPVASNGSASTAEDTPVAVTLSATDIDSAIASYTVVTGPANGSLSGIAPNLTYTPNGDFNGADSFTFTASDGTLSSNVATISLTVTAVDDAPVASNGSVSTDEDTAAAVTLVANDVDGDPLTYAVVTGPTNGSLSGTAPNLTYTPNGDYNGSDSFTFTANDGTVDSNVATVSITVNAINDVPVASNDSATTGEDTGVAITLVATDVDSAIQSYNVVTGPSNGSLSGTAPNLTYTPNGDYNGSDSFTFTANDGTVDSNVATVSITVNAINDVPVASNDSATTGEDTGVAITLVATDVDSVIQSYNVVTGPANGSLSGTAPYLTYTPNAGYSGSDSFTFTANDGTVDSNLATVDITVTAAPSSNIKLVRTTISGVTNTGWTTVSLGDTYTSPVIVATPIYAPGVTIPVVTRISNITSTGFDLKLNRPDGLSGAVSFDVAVVAVEEGVYTQAVDGATMEAVKYTSAITANGPKNWTGEARNYQNSYTTPVVIGQVMSNNDANWSVFWSMGATRQDAVDATNLNVGKHVGQDPNTTRANETIGYIVIESGSGAIDGIAYEAGLGAATVQCFGDSSSPFSYSLSGGLGSVSTAAVSQSGMSGNDGAWAVLSGSPYVTTTSLNLHVAEDEYKDSRQRHSAERVGYIVFE